MPDIAASTCSHRPSRRHTSAMAGTGSKAVVEVVPAVAQTKNGRRPAARSSATAAASASGSIAWRSSWATTRRLASPTPAMRTPFSIDEWACDVAYAIRSRGAPSRLPRPPVTRSRAARMAHNVASDAVPWMTPPPAPLDRNRSGSPSSPTIQSTTRVSSSVQAGLVAQSIPLTPRPAESSSPRIAG